MKINIRLVVGEHPYIGAGEQVEFVVYGQGLTQDEITRVCRSKCDTEFGIRWKKVMVVLFDGNNIYDNWLIEQ